MILIRADANEIIGSGHIMRCISIAFALQEKGEQIAFVTADHKSDILLNQKGIRRFVLNTNWANMNEELPVLSVVVKQLRPSLVLVDSYYVSEEYFMELSKLTRIAYMDDLATNHWRVDYLINYNIYYSTLNYSKYDLDKTHLVLGTQYAPLRNEFKGLPRHKTNCSVKDVLVSTGGADPENITEKLIIHTCNNLPNITFHFVVGAFNSKISEIRKIQPNNVILHINEKNMSDLMQKCDVAISAGGSTLYELCACGIPTITYTLADNQLLAAKEFDSQNVMINAGDCRNNENFFDIIYDTIQNMNKEQRFRFSQKMQLLVDGSGAERIAQEFLNNH